MKRPLTIRIVEFSLHTTVVAIALQSLTSTCCVTSALGFEARLLKESSGPAFVGTPCPLATSTDGTAANYRWYNICSGYVWIYSGWAFGEAVGTLLGGPEQPEVSGSNIVKRAITYFRNVVPGYTDDGIDIYIDQDLEGDGCPDASWLSDLDFVPALRWNCSEFNSQIPQGFEYLIVRTKIVDFYPLIATDGPFTQECDPVGAPRSFYYGVYGNQCVPWIGPTGRSDNFLYWLILDRGAANAASQHSWGAIKALFR